MAKRTTPPKVQEISPTALSIEQIDAYIAVATVMVDDIAAVGTLSDSKLAEIERWLTAHLIEITRERRGIEIEIGESRVKYSDVFGENLKATHFGQMVSQLDTTGVLAAQGKKKADLKVITSFD